MIGDRLRFWGVGKFGSVKSFAEALGMKPPALQKYLNNEREPGARILIKLYELGCDINWLLTGKDTLGYGVREPSIDYANRCEMLEEENRLLKDRISQISTLTQAINLSKKMKKKK